MSHVHHRFGGLNQVIEQKTCLKSETWTKLEGHHMGAGSTRYFLNIPAHPNPSTYQTFKIGVQECRRFTARMNCVKNGMDLGCNDDNEGNEEGNVFPVKDLDGGDDVDGVDGAGAGVGKNGDEDVLLDVERAGVKCELPIGPLEDAAGGEGGGHEVAEGDDGDLG